MLRVIKAQHSLSTFNAGSTNELFCLCYDIVCLMKLWIDSSLIFLVTRVTKWQVPSHINLWFAAWKKDLQWGHQQLSEKFRGFRLEALRAARKNRQSPLKKDAGCLFSRRTHAAALSSLWRSEKGTMTTTKVHKRKSHLLSLGRLVHVV